MKQIESTEPSSYTVGAVKEVFAQVDPGFEVHLAAGPCRAFDFHKSEAIIEDSPPSALFLRCFDPESHTARFSEDQPVKRTVGELAPLLDPFDADELIWPLTFKRKPADNPGDPSAIETTDIAIQTFASLKVNPELRQVIFEIY